MYVVDIYRAVIEHPQFMPDELKQRPDLRYGDDRGRIYRIVPVDHVRSARSAEPGQSCQRRPGASCSSTATPGGAKRPPGCSTNGKTSRSSGSCRKLSRNGREPTTRVHALWALEGLAV